MTRAMRALPRTEGPRWLRWAVVRDGRIEREAVFSPDRALTVGSLGDVPCAAIAKAQPLAVFANGRWRVLLSRGWTAHASGRAASEGEIELETTARISIDGASVLLQLVERPPVRATPQLPASVRGGFLGRADWWFTSFVVGSLMLHFALVVLVLEGDYAVESISVIPERYVETIYIEPPEPEDAPTIAERTEEGEPAPEEATTGPSEQHATNTPRPRPRTADPEPSFADPDLRETFADLRQMMLGTNAGQGLVPNLMENGASTANSAELIAQAEGVQVGGEDVNVLRERNHCASCDGHGLATLDGTNRPQRSLQEGEEIVEVVVPAPQPDDFEPVDPPPPDFDPRDLYRTIRGRMRAIQACYEHEMTTGNPDLRGRLTMQMQVVPVGTVSGVRAVENTTGSEALAACTVRNLQTVRLRTGPSEPVTVRYPIVFERQ